MDSCSSSSTSLIDIGKEENEESTSSFVTDEGEYVKAEMEEPRNHSSDTMNDFTDLPNGKDHAQKAPIVVVEAPKFPSGLENASQDVGRPLSKRLLHPGPIFAIFIVFVVGMTTSILHVSWWPITTPGGCLDLLVFLTWNYLVLHNLLNAAFYGGGYIPNGWHPHLKENEKRSQFCQRCNGYKAPRSHHCTKCNRCVMKMDHHCPWINNCVGHRNQVLFMRFLFFAVVGCTHASVILFICLWRTLSAIYWLSPGSAPFFNREIFLIDSIYVFLASILAFSFAVGVVIAVGFLFFVQLRCAWRNKTGIEQYICLKAVYRDKDGGFIFPYDLGWRNNLREVWNAGSRFPRGNGIWWPTADGCDQFTLSEEQLEQKRIKQEYLRTHPPQPPPNTWMRRFYGRFIEPIVNRIM